MKNLKKIFFVVLITLTTSFRIQAQVIPFAVDKDFTKDGTIYTYKDKFQFKKIIAKGDSIIGFNDDFCRVSFDAGKTWDEIDLVVQTLPDENQKSFLPIEVFCYENKVILFNKGEFFISENWKTFQRINQIKTFNQNVGENLKFTKSLYLQAYIFNSNFVVVEDKLIDSNWKKIVYISKDCNEWKPINLPPKVRVLKIAFYQEDIYVMTLKNVYKSSDKGMTWNKIDEIVYPYSVELMSENQGSIGIGEFIVFDNNIFIEYTHNAPIKYIYNLKDKSSIKLENIKFSTIKEDTLFLKTSTNKFYYYKDVLAKLDIDLTEFDSNGMHGGQKLINLTPFNITNNLIIIDGQASIRRKKESTNKQENVVFSSNTPQTFPNLIIKGLKILDNNQVLEANEKIQISFLIKNEGKGIASDIVTKVSNPNSINGIELKNPSVISSLNPNDSVKVFANIFGNINLKNGNARILFSFEEKNGFSPEPTEIDFETKEFVKPLIKIVDYAFITDNGTINKGLPIKLKVILQNIGQGIAENIKVSFKYPQSNVLPNSNSEHNFSKLTPGESKEIVFEFITNKLYASNTIPIEILINEKYGSFAEDKEVYAQINGNSNISSVKIKGNYEEKTTQIIEHSLTSDVDKNIPQNNYLNTNRYALIIGNEDYSSKQIGLNTESNVEFAMNDAKSFYEYATKVLGVSKDNCFLILNATSGEMSQKINVLSQILTTLGDKAEFIFYYAGHGFPDEVTKTPYLIPVDVSATNLQSAIKVTDLYKKLSETKAKRITVFLDACFTGGGRDQGLLAVRGVKVIPKIGFLSGNMTVFSATNNEQSALPYKEKQHGMFTYYLLKKLQENNGNVTYSELQNYIKEQVSIQSLKINSKSQEPQINLSPDVINVWENWKFN